MAGFSKDPNLMPRCEFALHELRRIIDKLHVLHRDIEHLSQDYRHLDHPDPEVEVRLRASVLLFESYFYMQNSIFHQPVDRLMDLSTGVLRLFLNRGWRIHEMGQLLFSVNTIFNLLSVRDVALPRNGRVLDYTLRTRKDIYPAFR